MLRCCASGRTIPARPAAWGEGEQIDAVHRFQHVVDVDRDVDRVPHVPQNGRLLHGRRVTPAHHLPQRGRGVTDTTARLAMILLTGCPRVLKGLPALPFP